MNSILLQISSKYLRVLLIAVAIIALLRGHNYPGGGFIGGLLAALSVIFKCMAYTPHKVLSRMSVLPETYMVIGVAIIILSTLPSVFGNSEIMTGIWWSIEVFSFIDLKIGTPFIFDIGVFFAVIGITLLIFFTLSIKE